MDQLKKIMKVLVTHRFWIICGIVIIVPLGGWFTTTAAMRETTTQRKQAIKTKFDEAKSVAAKPDHPNETSLAGMEGKVKKLKDEIKEAWQFRYAEQEKLLVWPAPLGPEFKQAVEKLNPIERVKFPTPPADEIHIRLREIYRDYIELELPKLAQIIDSKWAAQDVVLGGDGAGPTGYPGGGMPGAGAEGAGGTGTELQLDTSKVLWDPGDQSALKARYNWDMRPDRAPKTVDILYAQEDLWLMTALMNIIAETNQGATARYNSVVKQISYINVGSTVGGSTGFVMRVSGGSATGGEPGMGGMPAMPGGGMPYGGGMPGMPGAASSGSGAGSSGMPNPGGDAGGVPGMGMGGSPDPANYRYVDRDYKPLPAKTVRDAIESDAQNVEEAYLLVAKRIPIRMGLTIDQRKLNRFITACGNSKLMVEVRQVRFNRQGGSNAGGGMGGGMPGMPGMGGMTGGPGGAAGGAGLNFGGGGEGGDRGGMGGMPGGGMPGMPGGGMPGMPGGYGMPGGDPSAQPSDASPHDKPVEIYGIVYIYNPVDTNKIKFEEAAAAANATATPTPATPADTGAANTTPTPANTTPANTTPNPANPATPATPATPAPAQGTAPTQGATPTQGAAK